MSLVKLSQVLKKYLPGSALDYCCSLWEIHPFHFTVTRQRSSKYGDYRYYPKTKEHSITINGDLNPYAFLITYIHEYAHLLSNHRYGTFTSPHGREWKDCFRETMEPLLNGNLFPSELRNTLKKHMHNPKASSAADPALVIALRAYDNNNLAVPLSMVKEHTQFSFNGKTYIRLQKRRTRIVCRALVSDKLYLIHSAALVETM